MTAGDQLKGWKDIARYLGVETRTAQRYVKRGLPIRRTDPIRGAVYAVKVELQAWRDGLATAKGPVVPPRLSVHALLTLSEPLPAGRYVMSIAVTEHPIEIYDSIRRAVAEL